MVTAKQMYEAYCDDSDWKNFQGNTCPQWDALPTAIQQHWEAVADAAGKIVDDFVTVRLASLTDRPRMWAGTRESFAVQLVQLVEVAALARPGPVTAARANALMQLIMGDGPSGPVGVDAPLDGTDESAEWCAAAVAATRAAIAALTP